MKTLLLICVSCFCAAAGEVAVLQNGFSLRADRIERDGDVVRLHTKSGVIEFQASQVASIQAEETVKPPEPEPSPAPVVRRVRSATEVLAENARKYNLPAEFLLSLAQVESALKQEARSPKGAIGVMQLMPSTAQTLGADPEDLEQNIEAGTRYLRALLEKYQNDPNPVRRALAAYNAGPGAVDKYNGVPPYRETQAYVEKVIERYWQQVRTRTPASTPTESAADPASK